MTQIEQDDEIKFNTTLQLATKTEANLEQDDTSSSVSGLFI